MKKLLFIILILFTFGCGRPDSIINPKDFTIVDTTYISKNGFGHILNYDVIIRIDSTYFNGTISNYDTPILLRIGNKIDIKKFK